MNTIILNTILLSILSAHNYSVYDQEPSSNNVVQKSRSDAPLINSTDPGADRFIPVGKLYSASACTATLIAGTKTPDQNQPALLLTAGHCILGAGGSSNKVIFDEKADASWFYTPNYFIDTQSVQRPFSIDRILYATLKDIDLSVLRLHATYGELAQQGVFPMTLETGIASEGEIIDTAHIPSDNTPEGQRYLRYSKCVTGKKQFIYEVDKLWPEAIPNDCAGIHGGSSGSPVFIKGTSSIIGVLNTITDPALNGCGGNRPCELINNKGVPHENTAYFIPAVRIAKALTSNGGLDINLLDHENGIDIVIPGNKYISKSIVNGGPAMLSAWVMSTDFYQVRYKIGLINSMDCSDQNGYSEPLVVSNGSQPLYNDIEVPAKEGIYLMCAVGLKDGGIWQSFAHATRLIREIRDTPTTETPKIKFVDNGVAWEVTVTENKYEVVESKQKFGNKYVTNCDDETGYTVTSLIILSKKQAPWRVCAIGFDMVGNKSPITFQDFE